MNVDIPDDLPRVRMDPERILQVLINLLGNALQYSEPGMSVELRARKRKKGIEISVRDEGIGLANEDLSRVFERFYRVDKSRSRSRGGAGIGLAIARHIVRAHHGTIRAESAGPGHGSTFSFTLPAL